MAEKKPNPETVLLAPVYAAVGEGQLHVELAKKEPDFIWREFATSRDKMISLMKEPLREYWNALEELQKADLRRSLAYLLKSDESVPYQTNRFDASLRSKTGSLTQKIFSSYQDILVPYDGYLFFEWMWEVLFQDQDWHAEIED